MALYYMSGVEIGRKSKRQERKEKRQERREERKEKRQERKAERKAGLKPKLAAKVAVAPARGAFLTLVNLNAFNLAKSLQQLYTDNPEKFKSLWLKFGGKPEELLKAVNNGANKKAIVNGTIGSAAAVAGAIAAATPIIIATKKILDETGISKKLGEKAGNIAKAITEGKKALATSPNFDKETVEMPANTDVAKMETEETETTSENKGNKLILPLGLAAALLFS